MPTEGEQNNKHKLLADDEPEPYKVINAGAGASLLLVCDHASPRFPAALGTMGLDPVARRCHLALDIGAGALTEHLSDRLGVTAVLARYSRLIVDCNRQLLDPGAFLQFGDGVVIPGNCNLNEVDKKMRADAIYWPYHHAIDAQLQRLDALECPPAVISIHSFTPVLNGVSRKWEFGILWDSDRRISEILIHELREAGYLTGDNEPYSGKAPQDFTIDHHAEARGLPHVGVEVRQDLIDDASGVAGIGELLCGILDAIPARIYATDIETGEKQIPA